MKVEFNTNRLRPMAIKIERRAPNVVPKAKTSLLHAIVDFSVYSGLREIPRPVVERLRSDKYFPFVFVPMIARDEFYYTCRMVSFYEKRRRELAAVLAGETVASDHLICQGMKAYLNNFPNSMPGGINRQMAAEDPEEHTEFITLFTRIDELLAAQGRLAAAEQLGKEARAEVMKNFKERKAPETALYQYQFPHLKLSLEIFEALIAKHGYDAGYLWR